MAHGETCGLKTTNEEIDVFVALDNDCRYDEILNKIVKEGKYIIGIYNSISDLKRGMKWNSHIKYCKRCKLKIEEIEDIDLE